jgi:hypothetical protein
MHHAPKWGQQEREREKKRELKPLHIITPRSSKIHSEISGIHKHRSALITSEMMLSTKYGHEA